MPPKVRHRYIAFELADASLGPKFVAAVHAAFGSWPKEERPIILFLEHGRGLVRSDQFRKVEVVRVLGSMKLHGSSPSVRTIGTSGTIRRARARYLSKR